MAHRMFEHQWLAISIDSMEEVLDRLDQQMSWIRLNHKHTALEQEMIQRLQNFRESLNNIIEKR